jgi:hypothetical protein
MRTEGGNKTVSTIDARKSKKVIMDIGVFM